MPDPIELVEVGEALAVGFPLEPTGFGAGAGGGEVIFAPGFSPFLSAPAVDDGDNCPTAAPKLSISLFEGSSSGFFDSEFWATSFSGSGAGCSCILRPMTAPVRHRNVQVMARPILCSRFIRVLLSSDGLR